MEENSEKVSVEKEDSKNEGTVSPEPDKISEEQPPESVEQIIEENTIATATDEDSANLNNTDADIVPSVTQDSTNIDPKTTEVITEPEPEAKEEAPPEELVANVEEPKGIDSMSGNDLNASELLENPAEVDVNENAELHRTTDEFALDPMDTSDNLHLDSTDVSEVIEKMDVDADVDAAVKPDDDTNKDSPAPEINTIEEADSSLMNVDEADTSKNTTSQGEHEHDDDNVAEDIEQGKGADEEVSLLPEREISDADKERAILVNTEQVESVAEKSAVVEPEKPTESSHEDDEPNETTVDDSVNESIGANVNNDEEEEVEDAAVDAPKDFEIKDSPTPLTKQTCFHCAAKNSLCEFMFIENDENRYICDLNCVTNLRAEKPDKFTLNLKKIPIFVILEINERCVKCSKNQLCNHRMKQTDEKYDYICDVCISDYIGNSERYMLKKKRYLVDEVAVEKEHKCLQCSETKLCKYMFKQENDELYICHEDCLNLLVKEQPDKIRVKRRSVRVRELPLRERPTSSGPPEEEKPQTNESKIEARTEQEAEDARQERELTFMRHCAQCHNLLNETDKLLNWETLDFCNETCLGAYQNVIGSNCTFCSSTVSVTSLGKYCVRFGYEIKQFCRSICLDEYKKGLKVCSYCQKNISCEQQGFLAPVGDKGQFKDFCTQHCMKKYDEMCNPKKKSIVSLCAVCNNEKPVRVEVLLEEKMHKFCSNPCFSAFKFVNNVYPDQCQMCQKHFERKTSNNFTIYQNTTRKMFCSKICMNIYIITNRKIVPCNWCKVKKYNFDMINKTNGGQSMMMCSLNCLTLCKVSMNAISMTTLKCDQCNIMTMPQYLLSMSDASIRNFCTYQCVMSFQSQFSKAPLLLEGENVNNLPIPTGLPKRVRKDALLASQHNQNSTPSKTSHNTTIPVISNVTSLAGGAGNITTRSGRKSKQNAKISLQTIPLQELKVSLERIPPDITAHLKKPNTRRSQPTPPPALPPPIPVSKSVETSTGEEQRSKRSTAKQVVTTTEVKTQVVVVPPIPKKVANIATMCKPFMQSTGVDCRPEMISVECQTDDNLERKILIPIPVPIYVPQPMYMYSLPTPIPVPIPLPIPVPVFIPTTRNSAQGIMKEIKKIQDKMPTDPFEAELLMMAEIVAGEKKRNDSDSGSDVDEPPEEFPTETIENSNTFGEDMLQMALKMATEYDEPAVDLESAMPSNTITPNAHPHSIQGEEIVDDPGLQHHHMLLMEQHRQLSTRGRKRGGATATVNRTNSRSAIPTSQIPPNKKPRREMNQIIEQPQPEPPREPAEKADANMCLKFTFGVNAWKQWVMTKNADLEKSSIRRKPFKSDLLQLTADELNYSLCLFVKEVRKPNGSEYAPDTIYYLVLGIQQYLYEHGRIDNIFTDPYYEKFTDCLDEVARKFSVLYNDSQYIVTRVEEEHLWECKQLGAHSPHVLLSTLMFFNTKHFNLTTVEEHMQLSFSHIMKHWKRNPNQPGAAKSAGSRNVLLRFYPPQSSLDNNARKKKVYEQQENEENPLRCPVKLYEFYLSKCPESVKTRNDVFYLQPERSCVPDSPVWYSTQALSKESLSKMLHRVKMVKEINIALLTS